MPVEAAPAEDTDAVEEPAEEAEEAEAAADETEEVADESDETEVEAAADDEESLDEDETSDDPKVAKGLDQVRRAEKRMRQKLDEERQAFANERKQHEQALAELTEFQKLKTRAKFDAPAVLRALGLNEDDFELAAHSIYAESKAGAADPQRKAAAQARLREREKEEKLSATEKRIADLEAKLEQQKQEARVQAEAARYSAEVESVATAKFPLVAKLLKTDPGETTDALVSTYNRLRETLKRAPKPNEVVAAYDKRERARLQKLGIDPSTIVKTKPVAPAKPGAKPVVEVKKTAPKAKAPSRDEILAELESLS